MRETGKACTGSVCYACGNKGFHEGLLTCSQCKMISEHRYCTVDYPTISEPWICETCEEKKQSLQLPSKNVPFNKTKDSAKVKFISAEEVTSLALGSRMLLSSTKGCLGVSVPRMDDILKKPPLPSKSMSPRPIATTELQGSSEKKTSFISVPADFQSSRVNDEASHTPSKSRSKSFSTTKSEDVLATRQPVGIKSQLARSDSRCDLQVSFQDMNDEHLMPPDKALGLCTDIRCMESDIQGSGLSSTLLIVPNESEIQWRGRFVIKDMGDHIYEDIRAHFPGKISTKAYDASKALPEKLQFRLINRLDFWPKIFQLEPPSCDDVAMYFLPSEFDRPKEKYIRLLERMNKHDLAMRCHLDGLELLIYTSKFLLLDPQKLNMNLYLWGIFRHLRRKKLSEETGVPGEGNYVEADMEIDMVGGNDVGNVDKPVASPLVMQRGQLDGCGCASDQNGLNINNSSAALLRIKNNHEELNIPSVPPGFSKRRKEDSSCESKPLVKFALKNPIGCIISDIPPPYSRPVTLKHGSGSAESTGKSPIPQKYDEGHPASCATRGGHVISGSNTEKVNSSCHQVPKIEKDSCDRKVIGLGGVPRQRGPVKNISLVSAGYDSPESPLQRNSTLSLFPEPEGGVGNAGKPRNVGKNLGHGISLPVQSVSPDLSLSRPQYINDGTQWIPVASSDRLKEDDCGREVHLTL